MQGHVLSEVLQSQGYLKASSISKEKGQWNEAMPAKGTKAAFRIGKEEWNWVLIIFVPFWISCNALEANTGVFRRFAEGWSAPTLKYCSSFAQRRFQLTATKEVWVEGKLAYKTNKPHFHKSWDTFKKCHKICNLLDRLNFYLTPSRRCQIPFSVPCLSLYNSL